ncbi:MAG: SDR family NAD(P)-dependent oxidoreductase, partial [Burkholderiaceae bacterium]
MNTTIVTGASSGIGLATTVRLARNGHKVYAGVRDPDGAKQLNEAIEASGGEIVALPLDVSDEASITSAVSRVLAECGHIDVLVNNAGIARGRSPENTPLSWVREMFETNVYGLMAMTQSVLPSMRERRTGTIVQVSSMGGRVVTPGSLYYSASKFAVEAYSEGLAGLVGMFGIRVAIVEPGFTATPIFQK